MSEAKFSPSHIELEGDYIVLEFKRADIEVKLKGEMFHLVHDTEMVVRIHDLKILNSDDFIFESEDGESVFYDARQVKSFNGIGELLIAVIDGVVNREDYIIISQEAEEIAREAMKFHKENYINKCLEEGDFETLSKFIEDTV